MAFSDWREVHNICTWYGELRTMTSINTSFCLLFGNGARSATMIANWYLQLHNGRVQEPEPVHPCGLGTGLGTGLV